MAPARVERRLAAILAADVAGYSRLMGIDEEGTLAALKACRGDLIDPRIAEHRGRIVKTTGDGALVEFASAVEATRCAMAIQDAMAERNTAIPEDHRIELRIGINIGDVIIDEGDVYGDGVNIAARLEPLAEPGAICLSESAYASMDLFVVPTVTFKLLYGLLILKHGRREIIYLSATAHPSAEWISRQLTEAYGWEEGPVISYMIGIVPTARCSPGAFG
jgi:class 3 adenylate cyclase